MNRKTARENAFILLFELSSKDDETADEIFEKATGIKFEWVQVPQSTYVSKITSSVAAGVNIGDVILENNDSFAQLLSVSQPLNKIKSIDMNDPIWDKGFFNYSTFNGNVYHCNAINSPWQNGNMLYYNEKALKDNGITTPGEYLEVGKWSWDNAIKIMREFKALNSSYTGANLQSVRIMLLANGTEFMYMKNGKMVSGVNESAFKSTVEAFYDLQDAGLLGGSSTTLIKGTTAMLLSDTNGLKKSGTFKGQNASHIKAVPVPAISGSGKISTHYRAYAVCKGAKNPEGAGYFLRYFLDPYNYNWDDIFLNEDAKKVFVKYCGGADFSTKAVGWSLSGTKGILGATDWEGIYAWDNTINRGSSSQVNTTLSTLSSQVDDCVKKTNQILSELK